MGKRNLKKNKIKKRNTSDHINVKRTKAKTEKINPFELHVNKEKFTVLGKQLKHDKGMPGVSRSKSINKRKQTLGQEYLQKNKTNKFIDKRIGNKNMTSAEISNARYIAERYHQIAKKTDKFNLNEDEILTHRGHTLNEIEQFHNLSDDHNDDDDDDIGESDEELGKLNAQYIERAHFGGGRNVDGENRNRFSKNNNENPKDLRKLAISELIVERDRRKMEMDKEKAEVSELTEKLDANYKSFIPIMNKLEKNVNDNVKKSKPDDYDRAFREMIFERRGEVSDKLPTADEITKNQKNRLEKIEKERQQRMFGITDADSKPKHRSADDLDDSYYIFPENTNDEKTVGVNGDDTNKSLEDGSDDEQNEDENSTSGGSDDELNEDEHSASVSGDSESNDEQNEDENSASGGSDNESEDEQNEDENSASGDSDNESDDKLNGDENSASTSGDSESDDENEHIDDTDTDESDSNINNNNITSKPSSISSKRNSINNTTNGSITNNRNLKRKISNNMDDDISYNNSDSKYLEIPQSFQQLTELLKSPSIDKKQMILKELFQINDPQIMPENQPKMIVLFNYLLQYMDNEFKIITADNVQYKYELYSMVIHYLCKLCVLNPKETAKYFKDKILEKHDEYKKQLTIYPNTDVLIFFHAVIQLYSISDFRHQIVTPCIVFMSQILSNCSIHSERSNIGRGLYIVTILIECTKLSKRFLPASINFLRGCLYLCVRKNFIEKFDKIPPPFHKNINKNLLLLTHDHSQDDDNTFDYLFSSDLLINNNNDDNNKNTNNNNSNINDDDFKIRSLYLILNLIDDLFHIIHDSITYFKYIALPFINLLNNIEINNYPKKIREKHKESIETLTILCDATAATPIDRKNANKKLTHRLQKTNELNLEGSQQLEPIEQPKHTPAKLLRMLEPKFDIIYDDKRKRTSNNSIINSNKAMRQGMIKKIKSQTKSAVRELRRDNEFIAKIKFKNRMQGDAERKEKVKQIMNEASVQQSELNALERKKKHIK